MSAQKPVQEIRLGTIKACVWRNETPNGARHNVTVVRLYKVFFTLMKDAAQSFGAS